MKYTVSASEPVMPWKLFIDDERYPVQDDWIIARSSQQAIILCAKGLPTEISFDHDLGGDDTSMLFLTWLVDALIEGTHSIPTDFKYSVHSQNPVGAENIKQRMDGILRHFK